MALKLSRKLEELKKTKAMIKDLQDKQTLLEQSIKREEDEEIVKALRSLKLGHDELLVVLDGIQSRKIGILQLKEIMANAGTTGEEAVPADKADNADAQNRRNLQ